MKILLAADGSEFTRKAARQLAKYTKFLAEPAEIHLLGRGENSLWEAERNLRQA